MPRRESFDEKFNLHYRRAENERDIAASVFIPGSNFPAR
jgi:hypothetical protein